MADIVGSRLEKLIEDRRLTQSAVARLIGVSQPSIGRLISGETRETGKIIELSRVLETTPEYLIGEIDDPSVSANRQVQTLHRPGDDDPDLVKIHEIDLSMGMGLSYLDVPITQTVRTFDRNWLRQYTHSRPDRLFFCEGIGNSMEPYIHSHDLLLIDSTEPSIRMSDQIWACTYGNCGTVKRLRPMPDGSIKMIAENPSVPDEVAYDGELHLIGRVVAIVRKI